MDNEEVGSGNKAGGLASTFLYDVLLRIQKGLGGDYEDYLRLCGGQLYDLGRQCPWSTSQLYRKGRSGEPALSQ